MHKYGLLLFACLVTSCGGDRLSELNAHTTRVEHGKLLDNRLTLSRTQEILANRTATQIESIPLAGYSFHREIEIGGGVRVMAISGNLGGGLLLFNGSGIHTATKRTNEITWLQLFDIDEDNTAEIVTEEIDGRGTGVLEKSFNVYRIANDGFHAIWTAMSYVRKAPSPELFEERRGFVRFDNSGGGRRAHLTYIVEGPDDLMTSSVFEWQAGAIRPVSTVEWRLSAVTSTP